MDIDERCSFCVRMGVQVPERENFLHLFNTCPAVQGVLVRYLEKYGMDTVTEMDKTNFFFTGSKDCEKTDDSEIYMLFYIFFCFLVWKCKT